MACHESIQGESRASPPVRLFSDNRRRCELPIRDGALFTKHSLHEIRPPIDLRLAGFVLLESFPRPFVDLLSSPDCFVARDSLALESATPDPGMQNLVGPVVIMEVC